MKVMIDTCVLIDAFQNREPFAYEAESILILAAGKTIHGCITSSSSTDLFYIIKRAMHDNATAHSFLEKIFKSLEVLDTLSADCINALHSDISDYENALISEVAFRYDIDYIVTRNLRDFDNSKIPVLSPHDFLNHFLFDN